MKGIHLRKEPCLDRKLEAFWFQQEAFDAIRDKEYAAVFHEQGLGKSKIAIDLMLYWLQEKIVDTVLLVAKKSLVENWKRELGVHSYLKPSILTQDRMKNYYVFNGPTRLVLTHYEILKGEEERLGLFLRARSVAAILDESTKIKNPSSALSQAAHRLAPLFKRRVILTGTPIANRPQDIWSQVFFLDQGASLGKEFSTFVFQVDFRRELIDKPGSRISFADSLENIFKKIKPFTVRQTKSQVLLELPEKIVEQVYTDWEPGQHDLYLQIQHDLRVAVIRDGMLREDNTEPVLKRLMRLVQVAANPELVTERWPNMPGKVPYLEDIVCDSVSRDEKCIIWTSFTENAAWLARHLKEYGARPLHGKLSMDVRNGIINQFLDSDKMRLLIATPGAAKEGLTLTTANNVVFFDRSFSLDDYLQAQDRIHRISQKKVCHVYNLMMRDSIDEWVDALLEAKRLAAQLTQGDISREYYEGHMSFDFMSIIRNILCIEQPAELSRNWGGDHG